MKKSLIAISVIAMIAMLPSCGKKKSALEEAISKAEKNKTALHVQVGPSPETIDPALNSAVDGANMILHSFEGLLKFDRDNNIVAGLAESWEQSDDGLLGKGTYNILDYEWTFDFPIPIDYVIYRAFYFYSIGERGDKIAKLTGGIDIWEYVGIDSVSCAIYSEMESNFQKYVAGNNIPLWKLYQDVGGNLIGVKDAFSYELKMANAKRLEIISDDEVIYKTIAMTTSNGEYIASLPTFDRTSTQVIIPVGPCEYQIGGVYYINDDNQIVGLDYIASGYKNKKGHYVTGENYIRIEVDKIPEGLPSFLINYTIACEDKNLIIDDIVQEAELEAEIERTQELIEEGKKKIQELTERLMENN